MAPVVSTSIVLSSNKMHTGDILVPANPGPPGKVAVKTESVQLLISTKKLLIPHKGGGYVFGSFFSVFSLDNSEEL